MSSSDTSSAAHGDPQREQVASGELVERVERVQVADVVADEAHRVETLGQLEQRGALVGRDRWMQLVGHARRSALEPGPGRLLLGERPHLGPEAGMGAVVQGQRQPLGLDIHARRARAPGRALPRRR